MNCLKSLYMHIHAVREDELALAESKQGSTEEVVRLKGRVEDYKQALSELAACESVGAA